MMSCIEEVHSESPSSCDEDSNEEEMSNSGNSGGTSPPPSPLPSPLPAPVSSSLPPVPSSSLPPVPSSSLPLPTESETPAAKGSSKWQQKLLKHYGSNAYFFLKPTLKPKKTIHPKLLEIGGSTGSGPLFSILRQESNRKLYKQDEELSPELKDAYESYVHECSATNRKPVERVFCADDIQNKYSFYQRFPNYEKKRRMLHLMRQLCEKHEDSATVCLYNNPFPGLTNRCGTAESAVERYLLPTQQPFPLSIQSQESLEDSHVSSNRSNSSIKDSNIWCPNIFAPPTKVYYLADKTDYKTQFFSLPPDFTPQINCVTPTKDIPLDITKSLLKNFKPYSSWLTEATTKTKTRTKSKAKNPNETIITGAHLLEYFPRRSQRRSY
ncbi:hypothetical protein Ahia01_001244300 [Argonauta hians]